MWNFSLPGSGSFISLMRWARWAYSGFQGGALVCRPGPGITSPAGAGLAAVLAEVSSPLLPQAGSARARRAVRVAAAALWLCIGSACRHEAGDVGGREHEPVGWKGIRCPRPAAQATGRRAAHRGILGA